MKSDLFLAVEGTDLNISSKGSDRPWPLWKLALLLYVFVAGALAINLFMLGLLVQAIGIMGPSPVTSILLGLLFAIPGSWVTARWVRRLIDEAEGRH